MKHEGHNVISLDLPGHGKDRTPIRDITLESYVDTLCDVLEKEPDGVVLVGHSRGGIVISQAAERMPEKVQMLVYLAAYLVPNGQAMLPIALSDKESLIGPNLELNEAEGWHMIKDSAVRDALYGDCSDEDVELARSLLTREPNAPLATPLALTEANHGSVPRFYIETLNEKGCSTSLQRRMRSFLPCQKVLTMNTSHSPFLSAPNDLAGHLLSLSGS